MTRYFVKGTDKEVKVGMTVQIETLTDTDFGKGKAVVNVPVTQASLELLIKKGLVEKRDEFTVEDGKKHLELLKPYIRRFARKNKIDFPQACAILAEIAKISPVAHIEILLEQISEVLNRERTPGFSAYYLSPLNDYHTTVIPRGKGFAPVFYNNEDAKEAYKLIAPFVDELIKNGK